MTLHSSTLVRLADNCPRAGYRARQGLPGTPWGGFLAGSIFHEHVAQLLKERGYSVDLDHDPTPLGVLGPTAQQDHREMMERLERKGWLLLPEDAVVERSYIFWIGADGLPVEISGDGPRVLPAPPAAIRGASWRPESYADQTVYRLQPDAWFVMVEHDGRRVLVIRDWKTSLGLIGHEKLASDPQVITYSAAIAILAKQLGYSFEAVRFEYVNVRFGVQQQAEASMEAWLDAAVEIWKGCAENDAAGDEPEQHPTPGDHCGTCAYAATCRPNSSAAASDKAVYTRLQFARQEVKRLDGSLKARCRERTSALELEDGTILGPHPSPTATLPRKSKKNPDGKIPAMRAVAAALGSSWAEHFKPEGSVREWAEQLPARAADALEPFLKRGVRVKYMSSAKADYKLPTADDGADSDH